MSLPVMERVRRNESYLYGLIVAAIVAVATLLLAYQIGEMLRSILIDERVALARVAASDPRLVAAWLQGAEALDADTKSRAALLAARITALDLEGTAIADSALEPLAPEDYSRAPEVRTALSSGIGVISHDDAASGEPMLFVALPVRNGDIPVGLLRVAFPRQTIDSSVARLRVAIGVTGGAVALLLGAFVSLFSEYTLRGMRRVRLAMENLAARRSDAHVLSLTRGEAGRLASAYNVLADRFRNQAKKRAREKDRLRTMMTVMTDGVLILNRSGDVRVLNDAAAALLHTTVARAMRRSFVQTARDHRIAEVWLRCQESGQVESAAVETGPGRFLRVVVTPFLRGAHRGYLVVMQDLTEMRRLQTVRQDFISNISHELRTPLASLRALVETLRDSALDDPPAAERFLGRMEVEVDALSQMVEELLELSRIESRQAPLRLRPTSVESVLLPPVERLRLQIERGELELSIEIPADLPPVLVDAGRMHQVVTNLVHNAIKFTNPQGRVRLSARVKERADEQWVMISVADTGIGIPAENLPRIFERFYKTDRSRAVGGTGLGLAIAKHIVRAHGGDIWAESIEGKGSTFHFTLPIVADGAEPGKASNDRTVGETTAQGEMELPRLAVSLPG